jgi:hypothetical protein
VGVTKGARQKDAEARKKKWGNDRPGIPQMRCVVMSDLLATSLKKVMEKKVKKQMADKKVKLDNKQKIATLKEELSAERRLRRSTATELRQLRKEHGMLQRKHARLEAQNQKKAAPKRKKKQPKKTTHKKYKKTS